MSDDSKTPEIDDEELRIPEIKTTIARILVPVDGSPGSQLGMAWADMIAGTTGAEVIVIVAFNPPIAIRRRGNLETEHLQTEMEDDAKEVATEAAQLFMDRGRNARALVVRGEAAAAILETAESQDVDLIVMGRRGLGHIKGLLVGSVSERVSRHADIPVFLAS
jgi:nucleotide-binding universal stress UspA family protein